MKNINKTDKEIKIFSKKEFDIDELKKLADEKYPKFYDEFIDNFDNDESLIVSIKLAVNLDDYYFYDYKYIIRDLAINYGIYKDEQEADKDCYNTRTLEIDFLNFYCNLKRRNKKLYLVLKKNGITDKQMYDECFISSDGKHINYDINKLVKKYENIYK